MGKTVKNLKKKGIFFTFIAITIMAVFILVFTPQTDITLQKDLEGTRTRISSVDNYVNDLEDRYFEAVLRASSHKTISSLILYINKTGAYLTDLDSAFYEVILNGTINDVQIDSITGEKIMENSTLINWSERIIEVAKDTLNVNTSITILNVIVSQTKPWNIESTLLINFSVKSNVAEWKKNATITTTISIEGFYDPYYLVNTNGLYTNQIKRSSVEFNQWDLSKVREHLRNGTYVYWQDSDAPSFLMRFTNTISSSTCCGIESLVNPNRISPADQTESYVDYLFFPHEFGGDCTQAGPQQLYYVTGNNFQNDFSGFKLELYHLTIYNIKDTEASKVCP